MADVFEEVEDQLRTEQLKSLGLRILPWVGGALVIALIVALAYWGVDHFRGKAAAEASNQYSAALEAGQAGNLPAAKAGLAKVAEKGPGIYRAMALMNIGGLAITEGKTADAVKAFDQAATLVKDPLFVDLARLKSALALLDTAPYAELESRLTPLTAEKRPYRAQAKEALAMAKLMAGNTAGARSDFQSVALGIDSTEEARQRAQSAIELIDSGVAKSLPTAVKAASAMPALPAMPAAQGPIQ